MAKQSVKNRLVFYFATRCGWLILLLLGKLTRITYRGREHYDRLVEEKKPFILCVWHGRLLLPVYIHRNQDMHVIVSEHRDGEMIAQTITRLGFTAIRGSSTRGGRKAALGLIRALKKGKPCCNIPDGPNGPRQYFKPGTLNIAQKTGAALILMTFSASKCIEFRSWDRFCVWKPFSKSLAIFSKPIPVPTFASEAEMEAFRQHIEKLMINQQNEADAHFQQ